MDIKQKLMSIFDEASFVETDAYLQSRQVTLDTAAKGDGVISGYGTVDGRLVYAACQDGSFLSGALGEMHAYKMAKTVNMAVSAGAPVILFFDSAGARLKEGLFALAGYGEILTALSYASGMVPVISVIAGKAYGTTAYTAELADFVIMTNDGKLAVTSPAVLKANDNSADDNFGNALFNEKISGNVDLICQEDQLYPDVRKLLSLLPDNNLAGAPSVTCTDDLNRNLNFSDADARTVIASIADDGEYFELKKTYADEIITSLARLNGRVTGIIANRGLLSGKALTKAARFIKFCDAFNIPLLTLTDTEGFVQSIIEEENGLAKRASSLAFAFTSATVPKVNIITGKAYGGAYVIMNSKHIGADLVYAWENTSISPLSDIASAVLLFSEEIASSENPVKTREEKAAEYKEKYANPYEAAKLGYVDDVINPAETRIRAISAFEMLSGKRTETPARKRININI